MGPVSECQERVTEDGRTERVQCEYTQRDWERTRQRERDKGEREVERDGERLRG